MEGEGIEEDCFNDESNLQSNHPIIPVRTWATGSPFKVALEAGQVPLRKEGQMKINSDEIEWKGLEDYFSSDQLLLADEQNIPMESGHVEDYDAMVEAGQTEEQEEEEEEEDDYDDDYYEEDYVSGEEEEEYGDEDDEAEGEEAEDEEEAEPEEGGEYERGPEDQDDDLMLANFERLLQSQETPEKASVRASHSKEENYTDAYQELLQYFGSPRREGNNSINALAGVKNGLFLSHNGPAQLNDLYNEDIYHNADTTDNDELNRVAYMQAIQSLFQEEKAQAAKNKERAKKMKSKGKDSKKSSNHPRQEKQRRRSMPSFTDPKKLSEVQDRHRVRIISLLSFPPRMFLSSLGHDSALLIGHAIRDCKQAKTRRGRADETSTARRTKEEEVQRGRWPVCLSVRVQLCMLI